MRRSFVPVVHGATDERPDESDTRVAAEAVARALVALGHETGIVELGFDLTPLGKIAAGADLIFNLVEALDGDDALAPVVPLVLDHHGASYTGASADTLIATRSKIDVKNRLRAADLATPDWWIAGELAPPETIVIVKSATSHASLGIDHDSLVSGTRAGAEIMARERRFGGEFFAEAFIAGREFNIAIVEGRGGPEVLPVSEIRFDRLPVGHPHIVDYDAKWTPGSAVFEGTPRQFGLEFKEPSLAGLLRELALAAWHCCGLNGYARVDFRVDAKGRPFILEINPNPCLALDSGFVATAAEAGWSYNVLIRRIVDAALWRNPSPAQCSA